MKSDSYKEKSEDDEKIQKQIFISTGIIHFPERLEEAMKKAGDYSNSRLARETKMSEAVIRKYLKGESYPTLERAALLANALNCSLEWMVTGNDAISHGGANSHETCVMSDNKIVSEIISVLSRFEDSEKIALLNVIYTKGLEQIISLGGGENATLLGLSREAKQRLLATHEAFENAKKGASEGSELGSTQSPEQEAKRAG